MGLTLSTYNGRLYAIGGRTDGYSNSATGAVEIYVEEMRVLNVSAPPPFSLDERESRDVAENVRLKYRYLDLRRPSIQAMFMKRAVLARSVRSTSSRTGSSRWRRRC